MSDQLPRSRIAKFENGVCIIGMRSISMIPLISFDAVVNIYLTILFLIPLKSKYLTFGSPGKLINTRRRSLLVQEHAQDARQ